MGLLCGGRVLVKVLDCLEEVLDIKIPRTPYCVILHISNDLDGNRYKRTLLWLGLVLAKRDIAQMWKSEAKPDLVKWKKGMDHCMAIDPEERRVGKECRL